MRYPKYLLIVGEKGVFLTLRKVSFLKQTNIMICTTFRLNLNQKQTILIWIRHYLPCQWLRGQLENRHLRPSHHPRSTDGNRRHFRLNQHLTVSKLRTWDVRDFHLAVLEMLEDLLQMINLIL